MNTKYLFQALKFACLPTLSVLTILFFGFFNISNTIAFISSSNGWAVFLRIILVIAEIALVVIMYKHYEKQGIIADASKGVKPEYGRRLVDNTSHIRNLRQGWDSNDKFYAHTTENENIVVVERITNI